MKFAESFVDFILFVVFVFVFVSVSTSIVACCFFAVASIVQLSSTIISFMFVFSNLISNFINLKIVLLNEIIVYDETSINERIFVVVETYSKIWKNIEKTINFRKINKWTFSLYQKSNRILTKCIFWISKIKKSSIKDLIDCITKKNNVNKTINFV